MTWMAGVKVYTTNKADYIHDTTVTMTKPSVVVSTPNVEAGRSASNP